MHLKSLSVQGFKTFAEKAEFQFKPGTTAIVGPNGSGKSNIFDAIIWVLGDQNMRSIRGRKMEDVIFHGSVDRKQMGMAQVTLTFDNEDMYIPIPQSELSITRRYYRSGDSEFLINNETCRLKDIQGLFLDTGLGKLNYSIVTQGDIDYLVGLSPMERRAIFDEAAGVNKFKMEKKRALAKIKETEANLSRLMDLQHELHERTVVLETQAASAGRWNELHGLIQDLRRRILVSDLQKWRGQLDDIAKEDRRLREAQEVSVQKLASDAETRGSLQTAIVREETLLERERDELAALQMRVGREEEALKFLRMTSERLERRREEILGGIEESRQRSAALEDEIQTGAERIKDLEIALKAREEGLLRAEPPSELEGKSIEPCGGELQKIQDGLRKIEAEKTAAETACAEARQRRDWALREIQALRRKENELNERLDALDKKTRDCRAEIARLEKAAETGSNELEAAWMETPQVESDWESAAARLGSIKERLSEKNEQRERLSRLAGKARLLSEARTARKGAAAPPPLPSFADSVRARPGKEKTARRIMAPYLRCLIAADFQQAAEVLESSASKTSGGSILVLEAPVPALDVKSRKEALGTASDCLQFSGPLADALERFFSRTFLVKDAAGARALREINASAAALSGDWAMEGNLIRFGDQEDALEGILAALSELEKETQTLDREQKEATGKESEARKRLEEHKRRIADLTRQKDAALKTLNDRRGRDAEDFNRIEFLKQERQAVQESVENLNAGLGPLENEALVRLKEFEAKREALRLAKEGEQALLGQIQEFNRERAERDKAHNEARLKALEARQSLETATQSARAATQEIKRLGREIEEASKSLGSLESEMESMRERTRSKESELGALKEKEARQSLELGVRRSRVAEIKSRSEELESELENLRGFISSSKEELGRLEVKKGRVEVMTEEALRAIEEEYPDLAERDLSSIPADVAPGEKSRLKEYRDEKEALEPVNQLAIAEFAEARLRLDETGRQMEDCERTKQQLLETIEEFDRRCVEKFLSAFEQIRGHFAETFNEVFQGGEASLFLLDPENPLESGVQVEIQIPGKRKTSLGLLSGGEKALCTLTLIFAVLKYKPSPFYLLDEVDAGLDDVNVVKFRNIIQSYSRNSQFLVISHNKGTLAGMDHFYGVTMRQNGVSKVLSVSLTEAEKTKSA